MNRFIFRFLISYIKFKLLSRKTKRFIFFFTLSIVFLVIFSLLFTLQVQAVTYTTSNGTVSQLAYFTGIVQSLDYDVDYVIFRSSSTHSWLVYGQLFQQGTQIRGVGTVTKIRHDSSVTNNPFTRLTDNAFILNPGGNFVYSNLGDFPVVTLERVGIQYRIFIFIIYAIVLYFTSLLIRRFLFK